VEEEEVPGAGVPDEAGEGAADVGPRGLRRGAVGVGEDPDVGLVEAESVDEAAAHAVDVVVAALELGLGARVVDAHKQRELAAAHRVSRLRGSLLPWWRWVVAGGGVAGVVVDADSSGGGRGNVRVCVDWPFAFLI